MNEEIFQKKPISKKTAVLIIVAIVVIAALGITLSWFTSPNQQALRAIEKGDYDAVRDSINNDGGVRENPAVTERTIQQLEELKKSYIAEKIEFSAVCSELDTIRSLEITGVLETLNQVQDFIFALNSSRTYFNTAEEFLNAGNFEEALFYYKMVSKDDPDHSIATTRINDCTNRYRESILTEATALSAGGNYPEAISLLREALTILPDDARINGQITLYEAEWAAMNKADALAKAREYAESGDYVNAINTILPQYNEEPNDSQLSLAYEEYCLSYQNQVLAAADTLALEKRFDEAIAQINTALKTLPGNQTLKDRITALENSKPVSLSSIGTINGGWSWNEGTPMDPFGNDYSGSSNFVVHTNHGYSDDTRTHYAEYRVYGKYATLTGTLAPYTSIGQFSTWYIQVYTDDGTNNEVLVYTSPEVGRKTDAFEFTANIEGADYVKVCIILGDEAASIVCNLKVWP